MKADYIKEIIKTYEKSPYECILINGPWGVGKSYAIKEAFDNNNITKTCSISMFGLQDAQAIYHEVLFDLVFKDKTLHKLLSRATNAFSEISNKFAITKKVVTSFVKEKELFLNLSENFNQYHFVVIDDLERMNESIELEEVFGIIDELKRCNYVKVILVANLEEISKNILFDKYSEKVIDRIYHITERPEKVDWAKLGIHHGFITEFLSKHPVKNLRTLQKAQNLYDDVRLKLKDGYRDDFYNEIKESLTPDKMVTSLNRRIYEIMCEAFNDGRTLDVSIFAQKLLPAEVGHLVVLQNADKGGNVPKTVLKDCVKVILEENERLNAQNPAETSVEDWAAQLKSIIDKKK